MSEGEKKIVSDENWKQEAQVVKQKLGENDKPETSPPPSGAASAGTIPPANFITLVNSLVVQIMFSLGQLADPNQKDKKPPMNLDLAKHHIDVLGVLEEKTRGNLTDNEQKALAMALHEMRMQYVAAAS